MPQVGDNWTKEPKSWREASDPAELLVKKEAVLDLGLYQLVER